MEGLTETGEQEEVMKEARTEYRRDIKWRDLEWSDGK